MKRPTRSLAKRLVLLPALLAVVLAACSAATSSPTGVRTLIGDGGTTGSDAKSGFAVGAPAPAIGPGATEQSLKGNGVPVPQAFDPDRALILTASIAMRANSRPSPDDAPVTTIAGARWPAFMIGALQPPDVRQTPHQSRQRRLRSKYPLGSRDPPDGRPRIP